MNREVMLVAVTSINIILDCYFLLTTNFTVKYRSVNVAVHVTNQLPSSHQSTAGAAWDNESTAHARQSAAAQRWWRIQRISAHDRKWPARRMRGWVSTDRRM